MINEQIVTYENYLALPDCDKNEDRLLEILNFLKEINTVEIPIVDISKLFCHVISKFDKDCIERCANDIWRAFLNIKQSAQTISSESSPTTEERILLFLRDLVNEEESVSDKILSDFKKVCEGLERIKYIFILKNQEGKNYFPIGSLLKRVMESYYYLTDLDSNTISTFILAMEMFTLENDIQSKKELAEIVDKYNLEGLKILFKGNQLNRSWKQNLKANNVLVLIDENNNRIYIRCENESYFNASSDIKKEKNSHGNTMAYFVLKDYDESAVFLSLEEILMENTYNVELKLKVIDKIFNEKYYNILVDKPFIKTGNTIDLVNDFSYNDEFIITENNSQKANVDNLFRFGLRRYGLNKIWGNGVDFVIYNTLFRLLSITPISLTKMNTKMLSVTELFQDSVILYWLQNVKDIKNSLLSLINFYFSDVNYIKTKKSFSEKEIKEIYWLPYKFPVRFIVEQINNLCKMQEDNFQISEIEARKTFDGKTNFFQNNKKIPRDKLDDKINDVDEGLYYAFEKNEKFFINEDANPYLKILYSIQQKNEELELKSPLEYTFCNQTYIDLIKEKMSLQEHALLPQDKRWNCDFNSIVSLRILHHLIYNSFDETKWSIFCTLLKKHYEVRYKDVVSSCSFDGDGVLYIPKEARDKCGVLSSINETYIINKSKRDLGLYVNELKEESGLYAINNQKIKKIVFVFDTLQSGTSTKDYLSLFINKGEGSNKSVHKYFSGGREITITELITKNNPEIEILFFYGTHKGEMAIKNFIKDEALLSCATVRILKYIDVLKIDGTQIKELNELYGFTIKKGFYPIIREFNQPKKNIFPDELLDPNNIASLFVKKTEMG